jgi:hypothetical protein
VIVKEKRKVAHLGQTPPNDNAELSYYEKLVVKNARNGHWLRRLRPNCPNLPDPWDFIVASRWQKKSISREKFTSRLKECLRWLGKRREVVLVPPDIEEMLFQQAIEDRQMYAAYETFNERLQGDRFRETRKFTLRRLKHLERCSLLLNQPRPDAVPHGMSEWDSFWIGNLQDLTDTIVSQLRDAKEGLEFMAEFLRMGRTKLETYLLEGAHFKFAEAIKGRKLRIGIHALLVAYAHASELIRQTESSVANSDPVEAMKNRLARVKKPSEIKTSMHSLLLFQSIKIDVKAAAQEGSR